MKKSALLEKKSKSKEEKANEALVSSDSRQLKTRAERKEMGKQARQRVALESHALIHSASGKRDIIEVLESTNEGRVPELVPLRYGRMLVSPFTFFRGSAALMAMDLSDTPNSGFYVQACGDCHIHNMGLFATPERKLVIDINDFDETLPAPWEWDVKRLATSLILAAKNNGFSEGLAEDAARTMAQSYREYMAELSEMTALEAWYSRIDFETLLGSVKDETRRRQKEQVKEAVMKSSPEVMTQKMTELVDGKLRFRDMPPLIVHFSDRELGAPQRAAFEDYLNSLPEDRRVLMSRFELVDFARKVVGVGSVGTMCGVVLLTSPSGDALILQIKEARESVLAPYAGASKYKHQGQRVVAGQKLMQAASDMFLGWTTGRVAPFYQFYIRQLRDVKIGVNTTLWSKEDFKIFPRIAGEILARAHARSGDSVILRGYMGKSDAFEESIREYAAAYAKQTEIDYAQFIKACKSGRLKAESLD